MIGLMDDAPAPDDAELIEALKAGAAALITLAEMAPKDAEIHKDKRLTLRVLSKKLGL